MLSPEEIKDLYCYWCPREDDECSELTLEEKRGCVACTRFANAILSKISQEKATMLSPEKIKMIYRDLAVERTNEIDGVVGYDIDEVEFANRIIEEYLLLSDVCSECKGIGYLTFNTDKGWHNKCPVCRGTGKKSEAGNNLTDAELIDLCEKRGLISIIKEE